MANNLIQIKRSLTTATPASLANGELAFTSNGDVLYIGANGGIVPIAGKRVPGTLTANQALVANGSGYIDFVKTANLWVDTIYANGGIGNAGQVLYSNGSITYWGNVAATVIGSNTQIQFNDSGSAGASANLTFDKATSTLTATNISGNGASITSVNAVALGGKTEGNLNVNNATTADTANNATYAFGKSESGINANSALVANNSTYAFGKSENQLNVNSAISANSSDFVKANNGIISNSSGVFAKAGNGVSVDSNGINVVGGTGVSVNSTAVYIGQAVETTSDVTFNDITANGNTKLGSATSDVVSVIGRVNTSIVPAANVTYDLGTSDLRWKDLYLSGTTLVLGNATLSDSGGALSTNNLVVQSLANTQDLIVNGNTKLGDSSSDVVTIAASVNTNIMPAANVTYNLGNNTIRWNEGHFSNVHSVDGYFEGDVQVSGDLLVSGNVITTNVNSVIISDPLIYLAGNNYTSDLVDIGFVGNYHQGGTNKHTGVFRHAATDQYYVFKGLTQELDTVSVVNIADPSFALADVNAYLLSGGLVSNATHVAITANSTVNVAIVANTLTLTTALATTSGGTGLNSYTSGDILVANTGNALNKLSLGSAGYVLQSNGTALVYDTMDGGTF